MRFGKDNREKEKLRQEYLKSIKDGYVWWAWYPVKTNWGTWAWLEWVGVEPYVYEHYGRFDISTTCGPTYYVIEEWKEKKGLK